MSDKDKPRQVAVIGTADMLVKCVGQYVVIEATRYADGSYDELAVKRSELEPQPPKLVDGSFYAPDGRKQQRQRSLVMKRKGR
jgi:hypothetical protein